MAMTIIVVAQKTAQNPGELSGAASTQTFPVNFCPKSITNIAIAIVSPFETRLVTGESSLFAKYNLTSSRNELVV